MPESRKNGPRMTRIRNPAVPEEKRKERKGKKEAKKEGQFNQLPDVTIILGSHIYIYIYIYIFIYILYKIIEQSKIELE